MSDENNNGNDEPQLMTRAETARFLRVHVRTLDSYVLTDGLRAVKFAGKTMFDPDDVYEWVEARKTAAAVEGP